MMFTTHNSNRITRRSAARRGQSIVIALLVLLLLGLTGALFVTVIARNLINARHGVRVQTADTYARAGITYADMQISSSIDGADWRPPLQYALTVPPTEARELARYNSQGLTPANATDPDAEYLSAGYARYNTGAGRFLVRVTYTPVLLKDAQGQLYDPVIGKDAGGNAYAPLAVAPGKYLKIEAIGREGVIDPNDPTTYGNNRSSDRTQAYLVAYKPLGITDYARFETNPDKRSDIANLGVASEFYAANTDGGIATPGVYDFLTGSSGVANPPTLQEYPVITTYGAADAYITSGTSIQPNPNAGNATVTASGFASGGGSIHSNMPVRFFGTNVMYLNNAGANAPLFQDTAEIAGDLLLDNYNNANPLYTTSATAMTGQQAALILNPTDQTKLAATGTYIAPSNSGGFDTHGGLIRDGSMQNDGVGLPRSITRLDPPLLDMQDSASQTPRYRAIAMNSAPRANVKNPDGTAYTGTASPSPYGYGKAIYVNNPEDVQPDSTGIGGGSTLTDEWLHHTAPVSSGTSKGNWNGLYYDPPGVSIVLGQQVAPPASAGVAGTYGIRLVRSATDHFLGPDGTTNAGPTMDVAYADLDTDPTGAASDNDIIIYAEGNVRVRGIASPNEGVGTSAKYIPRHITIVTGGTAYIEGSVLKGSPDSSISILAHDYVCINTTQFLAGSLVNQGYPPASGDSLELSDSYGPLVQQFGFGFTDPGAATPKTPTSYGSLALYVSAGNPLGPSQADFNILDDAGNTVFNTATSNAAFNSATGLPMPVLGGQSRLTFDLSGTTLASLTGATGDSTFQLTVQKDPGNTPADAANHPGSDGTATQNPLLERVAVLPMDIRIEAVLYAQTRSFFVIPGEWFNTSSSDNLDAYIQSYQPTNPNGTPVNPSGLRPNADSRFPLYGQPIDLKITIDGSVSEAQPAAIAAQTEWMQKWGWIPQYHGSLITGTSEPSGHPLPGQPAIGLQIIYDPQAGYPYSPTGTYYLRSDKYGRPLPFTPKLPVSPGLLYSGQSGEAPLLQ